MTWELSMATGLFSIDPSTPAIGAEILGLDTHRLLGHEVQDALYGALIEHLVLFIRDIDLGPGEQLAFAESFGTIDRPHPVYPKVAGHPNVVLLKHGPKNRPDTAEWHTDLTFYESPPFASILWAKDVPVLGGDTLWSSMYAAYEALPDPIKQLIDDLEAVHDMGDFRNDYLRRGGDGRRLNEAMMKLGCAVHPLVKVHPVTGRFYLYVNQPFTRHIIGMSTVESDRLLSYLYGHINQPEFQVRFRWKSGSLVIWDNRVTQHYAVCDYLPQSRTMHRVTVIEDRRAQQKNIMKLTS